MRLLSTFFLKASFMFYLHRRKWKRIKHPSLFRIALKYEDRGEEVPVPSTEMATALPVCWFLSP